MSAQPHILVVDDSPLDIEVLVSNLSSDQFDIMTTNDGHSALALAAREPAPEVILLDVKMPDMDGYEVCRQLKSLKATCDSSVIFISSLDSTEEKLAGYQAGGDDYIIKPVNPDELRRKVALAIDNQKQRKQLTKAHSQAMATAQMAMATSGELGTILHFMRDSFKCSDLDQLVELINQSANQYGLSTTAQIRGQRQVLTRSDRGMCNPLEQELLQRLEQEGRIFTFGQRAVFNYEQVSLLVRNMASDDTDREGRLRDHLLLLLEGAQARLAGIELETSLAEQKEVLASNFAKKNHALQHIDAKIGKTQQDSSQMLQTLMAELEAVLITLDLPETQEERLLSIVRHTIETALDQFGEDLTELRQALS